MSSLFPEGLVTRIAEAPPEAILYCVHALPDSTDKRFLFFVKVGYGRIQPVVEAENVPAEFRLQVDEEAASGGLSLTTEFVPANLDPPFSCQLRTEFPWADPGALRCFLVLMEQSVWPYFFVSEDGNHILTLRTYSNPMSEEDQALCQRLIDERSGE